MHRYLHISLITILSNHMYPFCLIQLIDDHLVNRTVYITFQIVDPDDLFKYFFIIISDLRHWICDDRKAVLIPRYIFIHDL